MARQSTKLITADEYYKMPREQTVGTELVHGVIVKKRGGIVPAGYQHGKIAALLLYYIIDFVLKHQLGNVFTAETGFILNEESNIVRGPDIAFVANDRLDQSKKSGFFKGAPDLAVEVISPSETFGEIDTKLEEYFAAGVKEVWIVRPVARTITLYHSLKEIAILSDQNTLNNSCVLSGFELEIGRIFAWS